MYQHDLMRVIPLESAEELAVGAAREAGLRSRDSLVLDLMLKAVPSLEVDDRFVVRLDDVYGFLSNLTRAIRERDSSFLLLKRGLCVDRMVDVEEFVESSDYLNQKGYLRPAIKRKLLELFAPGNEYVEAVLCLRGSTKVAMLDGSRPTLKWLAENRPNDKFWVYSWKAGRFNPALARMPHKTGRDVLWRVTFEDGSWVDANARHQFVDVTGTKVKVENLRKGDRLASTYLTARRMGPRGRKYPTFTEDGKVRFVHREVKYRLEGRRSRKGYVIHHRDFNKMNAEPENLPWMSKDEHAKLHADLAVENLRKYNDAPEYVRRKRAKEAAKRSKRWSDPNQRIAAAERMRSRNLAGNARTASRMFWSSIDGQAERKVRSLTRAEYNKLMHPRLRTDLTVDKLVDAASDCKVFGDLPKALNCSASKVYSLLDQAGMSYKRFRDRFMPVSKGQHRGENHVVKSVECLGIEEDIYSLTVDDGNLFYVEVENGGRSDSDLLLSGQTGAIGIGKNYYADCALAYMVYVLSCFHNPQLEYDLAPGSTIVFIQQSVTLTLARKVVYDQFAERIRRSKYFQQRFQFDPEVKSELRFPKGVVILPVGGADTSALGMNVFGGVIDEMNFMARVRESVLTRYTAEEEYDQAERLYSTLIRRIKSRFMQRGRVPGKLLLVSSTNYPGDFTDRKLDEAKHDPTIFVMKYSQWEALPQDRFCGEKFLVEVGSDFKQSRIIPTMEAAVDMADVIKVPVEYKTEFERDVDAALRDLGGLATGSKHPFIPYRELMLQATKSFEAITGGKQLFTLDEVVMQDLFDPDEDPDWTLLVSNEYIERCLSIEGSVFAVHIDVGLTADAAGLAIGRIVGYKLLEASRIYDERTNAFVEVRDIRVPIYQIDGVLRILAPVNDEVDLELVRDLVLYLRGRMLVRYASCDSYQSAMMIQAFRKARMRSGILSVDTTSAPYTEVKLAIKDERIWMPSHSVLARELREVEKDKKKDKIDHPPNGSKDVCLTGDTKVSLLNGTEMAIKELVGMKPWVYSCQGSGEVVPAQATEVLSTGIRPIVSVQLDNGKSIRCTGNHPFMLRDGSYRTAIELQSGDSLMPLYSRLSVANAKHGLNGYRQILSNDTGKWRYVHQLVAEKVLGHVYGKCKDGRMIVHHKDFDKLNNRPDNFEILEWHEHLKLHREMASANLKEQWKNPEFASACRKRSAAVGRRTGPVNITKYNKSKEHRIVASRIGKVTIEHAIQSVHLRDNSYLVGWRNPGARRDVTLEKIMLVGARCESLSHLYEELGCSQKVVKRVLEENGMTGLSLREKLGYSHEGNSRVIAAQQKRRSNHKVVQVVEEGFEEVFDMIIPSTHNFALTSGVFVHNSDAVAGVVYMLQKKEASYGRPARRTARAGRGGDGQIRKIRFGTGRRIKA